MNDLLIFRISIQNQAHRFASINKNFNGFGGDKRDRTADLLNAIDGRVRVHQGQALQKEKPLKHKHFFVFAIFAHFTFCFMRA